MNRKIPPIYPIRYYNMELYTKVLDSVLQIYVSLFWQNSKLNILIYS